MALARFGKALEERERNRIALMAEMEAQQKHQDNVRRFWKLAVMIFLGGSGMYCWQKVNMPDVPIAEPVAKVKKIKKTPGTETDARTENQLAQLDSAAEEGVNGVKLRPTGGADDKLGQLEKISSMMPQPKEGGPAAPEFDPELQQMPGTAPELGAPPLAQRETSNRSLASLPENSPTSPPPPPQQRVAPLPTGPSVNALSDPTRGLASNQVLIGNYDIRQRPEWDYTPGAPPAPDAYERVQLSIPARFLADRSEFPDLK